jgi:hypothetical protein
MKQLCIISFSSLILVAATTIDAGWAVAQEAAVATAESSTENESPAEETKAKPDTDNKISVLSLPYQAIYRSVPQKKLDIATSLLQKELATLDNLQIVRGATANSDTTAATLDEYQASVARASDAESSRSIRAAVQARKKAVISLEANAGAMPAGNAKQYLQAHHELARTLLLAGDDTAAANAIEHAARLAPTYELSDDVYSRIYQKLFKSAGEKAMNSRRGKVMVKSVLPGAMIELDGRPTGVAPVLLEKVVPGKHLLVARIDGVIPFSTVINVVTKQQTDVTARYSDTSGGDEVGAVADALSTNKLPKEIVESAVKAGETVGAQWVIFGAMAKDDDKYHVHTYLMNVKARKLKSLDVVNFDIELLTAESDVLRIVQDTTNSMENFDGDVSQIKTIERRMRAQSTVNRFNASPEYVDYSATAKKGVKKRVRRPIFRPLKGGSITIKDEEE